VVNPVIAVQPQDPCRVALRFNDMAGSPAVNADGQPVQSAVTLTPGVITTLDYNPPAAGTGVNGRVTVRPLVDRVSGACFVQSAAQVYNRGDGITTVALPQMPTLPPNPVTPIIPVLGPVGLVTGQVARLSVTNVRATPGDPCRVTLTYLTADGQIALNADGNPVTSEVALPNKGATAFLDLRGSAASLTMVRPVVRRTSTTSAARCSVIAGLELLDSDSGASTTSLPPNPILPLEN
jgi:hypothetical protein